MKEFLLSLISPLKMRKYRYMTVFIAMLIFVVSVYVLAFPNKMYMQMNKDKYLSQKIYVNAYIDLPENINMDSDFIANKYKVNDDFYMTSSSQTKGIKHYYFEDIDVKLPEEEMKSINIHIVFDLENSVDAGLKEIREEYKKIYSDDTDERISLATYLTYVEWIKLTDEEATAAWKNAKYEAIHSAELDDLKADMAKLTNFDLFNINVNNTENNYMLMFFKDYAVSQIAYYDEKAEKMTYPSLQVIYQNLETKFDFSNHNNLKDFGNSFVESMFKPLSTSDQTSYLLQVVGYVIIFPAIFVLLLSWSMKKHGVMKTYKEYYNVAAISSILPLLVTFIIGWFVPEIAPLYGALFCLYTLFAFIKINSTPELGD